MGFNFIFLGKEWGSNKNFNFKLSVLLKLKTNTKNNK